MATKTSTEKKATGTKKVNSKPAAKKSKAKETVAKAGPTPTAADTEYEQRLSTVFTDRLMQTLDRRTDVIKSGRGQVGDFARYFNVHYTTAQRLLSGNSLPSVVLLTKISKALQVSINWLVGEDDDYDIDQKLEKSVARISRYSPRDAAHMQVHALVPISELPQGLDSAQLVYAKAMGRNSLTETIIAKVLLEPVNDVIHLVYYPKTHNVCLRRVQVMPSINTVYLHTADGSDSEKFKFEKLAFGNTSTETDGKVCVVGPVVASLNLGIDFN